MFYSLSQSTAGTSYSREELDALVSVCRRNNVIVLSDEIYSRLNFDGDHVSMAKVYPEGTIVTTGFSKFCRFGSNREK